MNYVWDNANIVESYPGICSPLTFSFARYVYREVYLQTAPLFGVERRTTEALYRKLETFLGYCDGRFYYNLETWCSLISYLPGFGENPRLLQEMMGVRPSDRLEIPRVSVPRRTKVRLLLKALYFHFSLPALTARWIAEFDASFRQSRAALEPIADGHAAMLFFFDLEQLYLRNWKIPILNDFAVMIYSGILRQLSRRFLKTELVPGQIADIGESGSIRMVSDLVRIAHAVRQDRALYGDCLTLTPEAVWLRLQGHPVVGGLIERFLAEFGLRNGHDLKLETANFREEPSRLVELLQQYLLAEPRAYEPSQAEAKTRNPNVPLWQGMLVDFFSLHTRRAIARREEMRVKRSQVFGMAREIFLKIGAALTVEGLLDRQDDVFYLEMEEVFGVLRGTATLRDVRVLVAQRRSELAAGAAHEIQAHFTTANIPFRAETRWSEAAGGMLQVSRAAVRAAGSREPVHGAPCELTGSPNYPALVSGEVIVMERPDFSRDVRDKIIVCRQTDPSWVPLLGLIKGLIVERGGILSHAAIVCRELKVPSIIGVADATRTLRTGQRVTLDSATGKVTLQ